MREVQARPSVPSTLKGLPVDAAISFRPQSIAEHAVPIIALADPVLAAKICRVCPVKIR